MSISYSVLVLCFKGCLTLNFIVCATGIYHSTNYHNFVFMMSSVLCIIEYILKTLPSFLIDAYAR